MKTVELRKMELSALEEQVRNLKGEIVKLRLEFSAKGKEGNVRDLRKAKNNLARVSTIINEKKQHDQSGK